MVKNFDFVITWKEKRLAEIANEIEELDKEKELFIEEIEKEKIRLVDDNFIEIVDEADGYYGIFEERVWDTDELECFFKSMRDLVDAMNYIGANFSGEDYFYINCYGGIVGLDERDIEDHYRDNFSIDDLVDYLDDNNLNFSFDLTDLKTLKEDLEMLEDSIEELEEEAEKISIMKDFIFEDITNIIEELEDIGFEKTKIMDTVKEEFKNDIENELLDNEIIYKLIYGEEA